MLKNLTHIGLSIAFLAGTLSVASAQLPGLPKIEFPKSSKTSKTSSKTQKVLGAGAGCVAGGGLAYMGVKKLGKKWLQKQGYSGKEIEQAAQMAAGVGCVIGGSAALAVIKNMDERAKRKQEEAWQQAKANTGGAPVAWEGPRESGYKGTVSVEAAEPLADGTQCITRKDYVVDGSGKDATVYNRYCKNASGDFEVVKA